MRSARTLLPLLSTAILALAACGGSSSPGATSTPTTSSAGGGGTSTGTGGATTTTSSQGGAGGATHAGGGGGTTTSTSGAGGTGGATHAGGSGGGCARALGPEDGPRRVIVAHPYDKNGNKAKTFELVALSADGALSRPGVTFEMGHAFSGSIVFTPDGEVAIAVHEDGTLGVVRFDAAGAPVVVHPSFKGSFYAQTVTILPDGAHALVVDPNWRNNGGGLYRVAIGCDGTLTDEGLVAPSKLGAGLALLPNGKGMLAAADVLGSKAGDSAHLLDLGSTPPALLGGADAFGDDQAIVSAVAATHDGAYVLIGDNSEFSGNPNRVAVVRHDANGPAAAQVLTPVDDPVGIVPSPFDDAVLVVSGYDNAFFRLTYDPKNAAAPFADAGPITYIGKKPELPGAAGLVARGKLTGRVLVAENTGIRPLAFHKGGTIEDLGKFDLGDGMEQITGALGVSP